MEEATEEGEQHIQRPTIDGSLFSKEKLRGSERKCFSLSPIPGLPKKKHQEGWVLGQKKPSAARVSAKNSQNPLRGQRNPVWVNGDKKGEKRKME